MTELAIRETATPMTLEDTMTLGKVLAQSGFFNDAKEASQAVVKVLAGRELGFGPIASMTGVHIVQGKPSLGANLLGAAIKGSGRYNYRVKHLDAECAEIAFYEGSEEIGRSEFTMDDAKAAGLSGKQVWKQYPKNMLFARALSNGARWYCPDVFSGVTPYTPEELGAEVDGETGEIIDVTPTPVKEKRKGNGKPLNGKPPVESVEDAINTLLVGVNNKTAGYYNHAKHLLNALRVETGNEDWSWPDVSDRDAWNDAYKLAVAHAEKQTA